MTRCDMKKCKEMLDAILLESESDELREHLQSCAECRRFAEDCARIRNAAVKPFDRTPPANVEAAIHAHAERKALDNHFRSGYGLRLKFWIPVAACLCACFLVWHYTGWIPIDASKQTPIAKASMEQSPLGDSMLNEELAFVAYDMDRALDELALSENDLLEDQFVKDCLAYF